jgi:hypothetical protein
MLMLPIGVDDASFWKTQGMARAVGVDLTRALGNGTLNRARYAGLVSACGQCPHGERCTSWLAEGGERDAPPAYCPLARTFGWLKARQA